MDIELAVPPYPALVWFARHGRVVVWVVALALSAGGALIAYSGGQGWWLAAGVLLGLVSAGLLRILLDIIRLLVETLIPQ